MSTNPTSIGSSRHSTALAIRDMNTPHVDGVDTSDGSPPNSQSV